MKKLIMSTLLTTSMLLGSSQVSKEEYDLVKSVIPSTKIFKVQKTPIDGLYEVYLKNKDFLYVYPFKELILFGEIYTKNGKNYTQFKRQNILDDYEDESIKKYTIKSNENKSLYAALKKNGLRTSIVNAKKTNYDFIVYHSPVCGFCIQLEDFFTKNKIETYKYYIPHEKSNIELKEKFNIKNPQEKIKTQMKLISKFNLQGTPNIIVIDKENNFVELVKGADINKLSKYIK